MTQAALALAVPTPDTPTPCAEWIGARSPDGYGHFGRAGRTLYVHRVVWEAVYGPIPKGLCVLHRCDNPPCYNLQHLFLGTKGDNIRDAIQKGRWVPWHRGKTHCKHGHEFTPENTAVRPRDGGTRRVCRACERANGRRYKARVNG